MQQNYILHHDIDHNYEDLDDSDGNSVEVSNSVLLSVNFSHTTCGKPARELSRL